MSSDNESAFVPDRSIPDFFSGKSIFVTGGSGFMGKVLIEKLLRSCPDLEALYLLIRPKKGKTPTDRLPAIFEKTLFDRLKKERPGIIEKKVKAVAGDVSEIGLGLSREDRAHIIENVSIVFHVAASVRFDDPLKLAVALNLRGTREVLQLAKELNYLSVLLHVSTSYSNTNRDPVEEKVYPPHADWRDVIAITERADEQTLRILTPKFLGELPNTYTFTKQLAEHVIYEQRGLMPVVIFRPSIVISTVEEPMPGWIENFNGPVGMLIGSGKGIMRSVYTDGSLRADYMAVDVAIKAMLVAAWKHGSIKVTPTDDADVPVYNCCSGKIKNVTMDELVAIGKEIAIELPLNDVMWKPGGGTTTIKSLHYVKVLLFHLLPALFVDLGLKLTGRKPMLVTLQRKIYIANLALDYYITNQWTFSNDRFMNLLEVIRPEDKAEFNFDFRHIDVYDYMMKCCIGARRYLLKEPDDTIPQAKAHSRRMFIADIVVKFIFYSYVAWLVINSNWFHSLYDYSNSWLKL